MSVQRFCRACFGTDLEMVPLFDGDGAGIQVKANYFIVDLLQMFTNEVVTPNDPAFSNYICVQCFIEMRRTNEFMFKCKSSAVTFRQLANSQVQLERLSNLTEEFDAYEKPKTPESKILVVDDILYPTISLKEEIIEDCPSGFVEAENNKPMDHVDEFVIYDVADRNNETHIDAIDDVSNINDGESDATESDGDDEIVHCPACLDSFTVISKLRAHLFEAHTMSNMCIMCDNKYFKNIWKHTKQHLTRNKQCWKCAKKFVLVSHLQRHLKFHMQDVYMCEYCSTEIKSEDFMKLHDVETHLFECEFCLEKFKNKSIVNRHKIVHSAEGPYKCDLCGKKLLEQFHFDRHISYHCMEAFNCKPRIEKKEQVKRSIEEKCRLIKDVEEGMRKIDAAKKYNLTPASIAYILKNKDSYLHANSKAWLRSQNKLSQRPHPVMEAALVDWIKLKRKQKALLNGTLVRQKAEMINEELINMAKEAYGIEPGDENNTEKKRRYKTKNSKAIFKADERWLFEFKKNNGMSDVMFAHKFPRSKANKEAYSEIRQFLVDHGYSTLCTIRTKKDYIQHLKSESLKNEQVGKPLQPEELRG